jgi:triosephosphate isomerase
MITTIKQHLGSETQVIYGGSVTADNVQQYIPLCQGALIGGASLDAEGFSRICQLVNS